MQQTLRQVIAKLKYGNSAASPKRRDWSRGLGAPISTSGRAPWLLGPADSLAFRATIFCQSIGRPVHLFEFQSLADGLRHLRLLGSGQ